MRRCVFLFFVLIASAAVAQQNQTVRVGVATLENRSGRGVPGDVERDRLVRALNGLKPDKKTHLKLEAVPLNGASGNDVVEQAEEKKCDYVVYTILTELRTGGDPYQHVPGTVETNPNSQWSTQNQGMEPEYRATVEYNLYNVKGHATAAGPPYSTQQAGNEIDTVSQIMDRVATSVFSDIKKGGTPPPMRE